MNENLKVGDTVLCRGSWGSEAPKQVTITHLELCVCEGDKYGVPVTELPWADKGRAVVDLSNGHWSYGAHIEPLEEVSLSTKRTVMVYNPAEHQHICAQCEALYDADGVLEEISEGEYDCNCTVPKDACPVCEPEAHAKVQRVGDEPV